MSASQNKTGETIPQDFAVSIIMQQSPSSNLWESHQWDVVGVLATQRESTERKVELIHREGEIYRYLYTGFTLRLHEDECESYYYNLLSTEPRCYVVTTQADDQSPAPFLVSFSYDEAHAYLEGDETVYAAAVPAEIYRWAEAFVLAHYVPSKRSKRKRDSWKHDMERPHGVR
jgi:hypothetical protein